MSEGDKLPHGWRWATLRNVIEDAQSGFASGERDTNGVIQLRMNNVDTRGNLLWDDFIRVPTSVEQVRKYQLQAGDVVFNNTNSTELVGKSALFKPTGEAVVYSNHFTRLRVKPGFLEPAFLAAWLNRQWQSGLFAKICNRWIGQSAVKPSVLLELSIPLPPLPEQRRIVAALEERLAAVERARQAARAQLAAARALPAAYLRAVFEGEEARGWECLPLGSFVQSYRNGFGRRPDGVEDGPIVLRIADVSGGYVDLRDPRRVYMTPNEFSLYQLHKGDALFIRVNGSSGIVGRCIAVNEQYDNIAFNDHLIRVQLSPDLDAEYLSFACGLPEIRAYIEERASTSAGQLTVNQQILADIRLLVPPISRQVAVVKLLKTRQSVCDSLIVELQEQLEEIETLPAAYLQQAFAGEL